MTQYEQYTIWIKSFGEIYLSHPKICENNSSIERSTVHVLWCSYTGPKW